MWPVGNRVRSSRAAHLPGFYLAQAVRSARPFIPVVALSVVPYTSFHDDRFRKGIPPSIVQPVRPFGPGTAPASPRLLWRGLGGGPSPSRVAAVGPRWPSPVPVARGPWGRGPRPASRVPFPGVPGWWRGPWALGLGGVPPGVRGPSRALRPWGVPWCPWAWCPVASVPPGPAPSCGVASRAPPPRAGGGPWCARPGPVASAVARGAPVGALWAVRPAPVGAWWWRGVRGLSPVARGRPRGGVPWPWGAGPCARCPRPSRRGVVPVSRRPASPVGAWRGVRCQ